VPTRYVIAEHWAPTAEPFMARLFPQVGTSVLGGHMMFWEHADRFNQLLEAFLADLG
jgi:non-heme chloroperoxidase